MSTAVNPKMPAIRATTRTASAHFSMIPGSAS
jgi:hypothetical protein